MTKAEWTEVEKDLKVQFTPVKLKCDGYDVELRLVQINQFKLAIVAYINGEMRGSWFCGDNKTEQSEEAHRFYPTRYHSCYSSEEKKRYRQFKKGTLREWKINPDAKYAYKAPFWTSFPALKRHLIANNKSIELIKKAQTGEIAA